MWCYPTQLVVLSTRMPRCCCCGAAVAVPMLPRCCWHAAALVLLRLCCVRYAGLIELVSIGRVGRCCTLCTGVCTGVCLLNMKNIFSLLLKLLLFHSLLLYIFLAWLQERIKVYAHIGRGFHPRICQRSLKLHVQDREPKSLMTCPALYTSTIKGQCVKI